MEAVIEQAVRRVINAMYETLGEQLTIDDMARTALFSKFHFTRVFQRVTGISPGRFLSAVRLQEAKELLTSTSMTVAEISHRVGYTSVGTFSSRFKSSVGVSPTIYRELGGVLSEVPLDARRLVLTTGSPTLRGHVWPWSGDQHGPVFLGLFPGRLPQGQPVACAVLDRPGPYVLENVPQGTWHLLAHSIAPDDEVTVPGVIRTPPGRPPRSLAQRGLMHHNGLMRDGVAPAGGTLVGSHGPIAIRPDTAVRYADMWLRPKRIFDPPVLLAPLDTSSVVA